MDWSTVPGPDGHPTPGGSGWYRTHLPHRALVAAGVPSVIGRLVGDRATGRLGVRQWSADDDPALDHWDCDIMVLQRWMLAGLDEDIRRARAGGQLVVQDVDDWFFGMATQNHATKSLTTDPRANTTFYRKILAASDFVIASTAYLALRLRTFVPDVRLVRNHIDLDEPDRWPVEIRQRDHPVLGWAGAVPWRSGDLETLRGVVPQVSGRLGGIPFHHSGHMGDGNWPPAYTILGLSGPAHTATPMAPIARWPAQFTAFDVGIVPLSDRPFNHAKSAVKGLEYAAAGKPFVAQATPEYRHLASLGVGRVAKRPKDWIHQLTEVLSLSADDRRAEAEVARDHLRAAQLTTDHLAEHWLEAVVAHAPTRAPTRAPA